MTEVSGSELEVLNVKVTALLNRNRQNDLVSPFY
jgi:hypothetical protein